MSTWIPALGLNLKDRVTLEKGQMLQDTHMHAAHQLIKKEFGIDGCQSTLLCQTSGFSPVTKEGKKLSVNLHNYYSVGDLC